MRPHPSRSLLLCLCFAWGASGCSAEDPSVENEETRPLSGGTAGKNGSQGQGGAGPAAGGNDAAGGNGSGGENVAAGGTSATGGTGATGGSGATGGTSGTGGSSEGGATGGSGSPGAGGGAQANCGAIGAKGWQLCASGPSSCEAVFTDGAGCAAVCAAAGLACTAAHENVEDACLANKGLPELGCGATGHQSDYCVCGVPTACTPDCAGKSCGSDGCQGVCGTCAAGETCAAGACASVPDPATVPAFPGAEGEGMMSKGGRGGDVYHVTNLDDSGAGSLRAGVSGSGARTVVFDVAGIITLNSPLTISRSKLTLAGQTAPGGGIVIRGYQTQVKADDVVIRHLRFRAGDIKKKKSTSGTGFTEDSLTLQGTNIIVDHLSASWGIDESLSAGSTFKNLTVQYSIVAEGLRKTCLFHGDYDCSHPGHSMGSLFKPSEGDGNLSVHHTLYYSNNNRNPAIGTYSSSQREFVDLRNNVLYNCPAPGYASGQSKEIELNYVGNYLILGPESSKPEMFKGEDENNLRVFQSGNWRDLDKNGSINGKQAGWEVISGTFTKVSSAFPMKPVTTQEAPEALQIVLAQSGALPWKRDAVDTRIIQNVKTGKGKIIDSQDDVGGWGTIDPGTPLKDSDGDGMPDAWESTHGFNPAIKDNNGDADADGYTNLEEYLHERANP